MNVVQTGGPGGQTSVFMRGTNSNHIKVLVDGIDVSDPSNPGGAFDFGQFLTQDIEKVEILRGPQSGLYGSDAIGGVINIITKSGSGPAQFTAGVEGGSFDTFNQAGGVSGSLDRFHYAANVEHLHAGATPVTPLDLLRAGRAAHRRLLRQPHRIDQAGLRRHRPFRSRTGRALHRHAPAVHRRQLRQLSCRRPDRRKATNDTLQYYTRATGHLLSFDGALEQTLGAAYSNIKSSRFTVRTIPRAILFGERVKFDWQGNRQARRQRKAVLGAEHQRDEITAADLRQHQYRFRLRRTAIELRRPLLRYHQRALRRQRPIRQQGDLPRGARLSDRGNRNEAQGQRRHRLQGADA